MDPIISPTAVKVDKAILDHDAFNEIFEINAIDNAGIVTLQGSVPSRRYLHLVETFAKGIKGILNVINEIEIDSSMEERADIFDLDIEIETLIPPLAGD